MTSQKKSSASDFQFQWGSNYGMDGFQYEMDYGSGNRDRSIMKDRQTAKGKLVLPGAATLQTPPLGDALFPGDKQEDKSALDEDEVFSKEAADLSDMGLLPTRALDAPIVDHSWFTMAEQDPARLPKNSKVTALTELQQLWTARTNGNRRETLLDPRYAQPFKEAPSKTFPIHTLSTIVAQAMRRSASGVEIDRVLEEATLGLPKKAAQKVHLPLLRVREEHGLTGRVFIRASAYPGCHQGKWVREVQKAASSAHYIVSKPECQGCPKNLEGTCSAFGGKQIVASVPWEEALEFYRPKLELSGRPPRSDLPAKEALRLAMAMAPRRARLAEPTAFHIQPDPMRGMTDEAAREGLKAFSPKPVVLKTAAEQLRERQVRQAQSGLDVLEKSGALSSEVVSKLREKLSQVPPTELLRAARWMSQVGQQKTGTYQGPTVKAALHSVLGGVSLSEANRRFELALQKEARRKTLAQYQKAAASVELWVRMGLLDSEKSQEILASGQDPREMLAQAKELAKHAAVRKRAFSGPRMQSTQTTRAKQALTASEIQQGLQTADHALTVRQTQVEQSVLRRRATQSLRVLEMALSRGTPRLDLLKIAREIPLEQRKLVQGEIRALLGKATESKPDLSSRTYRGHVFKEAKPKLVREQSRKASEQEIQKAASDTLALLNRGLVGQALVRALGPRHADVWPGVQETRRAHEGRAGRLYIAAEAHAGLGPVAGCERGAAMYREVPVKVVLQAPQCEDCMFRGPGKAQTEGHCLKFARDLISPERLRRLRPAPVAKSAGNTSAPVGDPGAGWFSSGPLDVQVESPKTPRPSAKIDLPPPTLDQLP